MLVIADTGPVNYLVLIGHIDILPRLFGTVILPSAVREELADLGSPPRVRDWIANPYFGMHIEYYVNVLAGKYTGVIEFFEGIDGQGPNPTVTVKGRGCSGTPPPPPPDPRPVDYFGHGPNQGDETTSSAGGYSSNRRGGGQGPGALLVVI